MVDALVPWEITFLEIKLNDITVWPCCFYNWDSLWERPRQHARHHRKRKTLEAVGSFGKVLKEASERLK